MISSANRRACQPRPYPSCLFRLIASYPSTRLQNPYPLCASVMAVCDLAVMLCLLGGIVL
ncbi:MAG: hypothetical protein ABI456_13580, partial [Ktedonobacteraceae bacterium]